MKTTRLILVRHGETQWNAEFKYIGLTDLELTEKGIKQAQALAKVFQKTPLTAFYSSPLKRAYQTARIVAAGHKLKVKIKSELKEIDFGDWEGLTLEEIKRGYTNLYKKWLRGEEDFQIPKGESWSGFRERVTRVLREILKENPEGTVAIVSHGGVLKAIIIQALKLDSSTFWKISQSQAALSILDFNRKDNKSKPVLVRLNDLCHLTE